MKINMLLSLLILFLIFPIGLAQAQDYCLLRKPQYMSDPCPCYQFYLASTSGNAPRAFISGGNCEVTDIGAREGWEVDKKYESPMSWAEGDQAMSNVSPYFDDFYGCNACRNSWDKPFGKPQYLLHATGHGTMNGPVKDDWHFLYPDVPRKRSDGQEVIDLPDGMGGTFTYSIDSSQGPFSTPREVCVAVGGNSDTSFKEWGADNSFKCSDMSKPMDSTSDVTKNWTWTYGLYPGVGGNKYIAPTGYSYALADVHIHNMGTKKITTNPYYWHFIADGIEYVPDKSTYDNSIYYKSIVDVGQGEEATVKFIYLVKGAPKTATLIYRDPY